MFYPMCNNMDQLKQIYIALFVTGSPRYLSRLGQVFTLTVGNVKEFSSQNVLNSAQKLIGLVVEWLGCRTCD